MRALNEGARRDLFIPILLCVMIAVAFNAVWGMNAGRPTESPVAVLGEIDLNNWDFAGRGMLPLNGQWEFYPGQLLEPRDFSGLSRPLPSYLSVPGLWLQSGDAITKPPHDKWGFGTYRLAAKIKKTNDHYAIRTNVVFMSSKLYVDGKLVGGSGTPAQTKEQYIPQNLPYTAVFNAESDRIEIVLQVANFDHYAGGIGVPLYFGLQQTVARSILLDAGIQTGSSMVLLVFGVFFLALFAVYIRDRSLMLFALFFIFFAGNILVNGEKLLLQLFSQLEFEMAWKLKNLTIYTGVPILYLLTVSLYGRLELSRLLAAPAFIVAGYCAAIALLPYSRYIAVEKPILYTVVLFHALLFFVLAINDRRDSRGAYEKTEFRLYTAAMLLLLVYKAYNIMYVRYYVPKSWVAPAAIMLFILLISLLLVHRYIRAYSAMAELTGKLRVADQMKDEFLLRTSVELKTPIQRILNLSEWLQNVVRTNEGNDAVHKVHMIRNTAFRISNMVDDLVDLAKIRDGRLALRIQAVDIAACVSMVFEVLEFIADGKRIGLHKSFDPDERFAAADENRLMQVLYHLIDDSLRHMEQGDVTVGSRKTGDTLYVTIDIAGKGTLLDNREIITQAFGSRREENEQDSRGLGWSYAIVDKLVELMNGTFLVVWTAHGSGYRYEIALPVAEPDRDKSVKPLSKTETAMGSRSGAVDPPSVASVSSVVTVLVLESEAALLEVLIHLLAMEGYKVVAARNAEEAMPHIEAAVQPDLVLLNMMMDGGSGYETARAIRRRFSPIELPILFIVSRNTPADIEVGLEAGGNDYITKPVDAGELRARIRTLLAMKRLAKEAALNEMAFLQSQIKPHFLYNALGTIMSLCYTDGRRAGKLLAVFSKYLRMLFQLDNTEQTIPLRRELELIQAYTEIEKERFGSKLHYVLDADPDLLDSRVTPLTIQPLVENAIRHGVVKKLAGGTVRLTIKREQEMMKITVEDDGAGMSEKTAQEVLERTTTTNGVGFASIRKRVSRMTGKPLVLESAEGTGTRITFWLPIYS